MKQASDGPKLTAGEHTCVLYERDPGEQIPLLVPFIREAFSAGQQFVYIADDQSVSELADRLQGQGVDVAAQSRRGALKLWTRAQWRQPGELDPARKSIQVRQFVQEAQQAGFSGVRFAVEMTWTLSPDIGPDALARWEATINTIFVPGFPASIVCLYNRDRLPPEVILAGLKTHPVTVVGNYSHHNCFYEAPLILSEPPTAQTQPRHRASAGNGRDGGAARVDWILEQLAQARVTEANRLELARSQVALVESERARQEIQASERRFRTLADSSPVLMWMLGPAGCEFVNRTLVEFFGCPAGNLLGSGWMDFIHPDDRVNWGQAYRAAWEKQGDFGIEVRARRSDGQWRWLLSRGVPHHDARGRFLGYIGTSTDIDERKQAEVASQRLAAIVEFSDDAIIGKDLSGVITSWNKGAERIFGYTAAEAIGQSIVMLMPPDRQHEEPDILERIRQGERIDHYETVRRRKDGRLLNISLSVSPIRAGDGRVIGASKIARDITERIRREQALGQVQGELARLNEELEQRVQKRTAELAETIGELEAFSYSITHDLRAPLRSMQSFGTLLEQECGSELSLVAQDYIRRIVTSARRMDRLIQDVLTYSRISRSELHLEELDLDGLVQGIIESYPGFQTPAGILSVKRPLLRVVANEAALTQCLSNLIGNAIKFVAPGKSPQVTVWSEALDGRVRIYVRDQGIGIPAKHQQRIFGIFQRLSKIYEGTGIGLSIVKKAAERMGGCVGLCSEPGRGSTFWIELQAVARKESASG